METGNQNIIYNYPKTSVENCSMNGTLSNCGIATNMSVPNCDFDNTHFYRVPFRHNIEPALKSGYVNLNPQSRTQKYAKDIHRVIPNANGCQPIQYAGLDPRLYDAARGFLCPLNLPPITSKTYLDELATDEKLNNYGQYYRNYQDINAGQKMYYIDRSMEDPYTTPVFAVSANATGYMFKDPMDSYKPEYIRTPLKCDNLIGQNKRDIYEGSLSFMEDTLNFREDIISKQMAKQNQTAWSERWPIES